jgi:undecaprenyl pyrophosphate phosphatase UppP
MFENEPPFRGEGGQTITVTLDTIMNLFEALVHGLILGLSEFLPVSSSSQLTLTVVHAVSQTGVAIFTGLSAIIFD